MISPTQTINAANVRHVGLTVSDLARAVSFWETFLGAAPYSQVTLEREYVQRLVGLPGVKIAAAFFAIPGAALELLEYDWGERQPLRDASFNPGHAHTCFTVSDIRSTLSDAIACGASRHS